jgi:hypothetical protein
MIDYIKCQLCQLCGLKSGEGDEPLVACKECGLSRHSSCFSLRFGKITDCCSKASDGEDLYCSICGKQGRIYLSNQLQAPTGYHLICSFNREKRVRLLKTAVNPSLTCIFCGEAFNSPVYHCMKEKEGCPACFHIHCYQYFMRPMDCLLEERLLGEVMICCPRHIDPTRFALYEYYRLLEEHMPAKFDRSHKGHARSEYYGGLPMEIEYDETNCPAKHSQRVQARSLLVPQQPETGHCEEAHSSLGHQTNKKISSTTNKVIVGSKASSSHVEERICNVYQDNRELSEALVEGRQNFRTLPDMRKSQDKDILESFDNYLATDKNGRESSPNLDLWNLMSISDIRKERSFSVSNPQQNPVNDQSIQQLLLCFPSKETHPTATKELAIPPQENKLLKLKSSLESVNPLSDAHQQELPQPKLFFDIADPKSPSNLQVKEFDMSTKGVQTWDILREADKRITKSWDELETCEVEELLYEVKEKEQMKPIQLAFAQEIYDALEFWISNK